MFLVLRGLQLLLFPQDKEGFEAVLRTKKIALYFQGVFVFCLRWKWYSDHGKEYVSPIHLVLFLLRREKCWPFPYPVLESLTAEEIPGDSLKRKNAFLCAV